MPRDAELRPKASVAVETDVRSFEDAFHDADVHHLTPAGSKTFICGMPRSEGAPCSKRKASAEDVAADSCSCCGRSYCPICSAHYRKRWGHA